MQTRSTDYREIGVSLEHPADWAVEHEQYMFAGTHGLQLWRPTPASPQSCCGTPTARVAVAPNLTPGQIDQAVQEKLDAYREYDLPVAHEKVSVGVDELEGVAVGPIPGSTPSYEVYVRVGDLVYLIRVYEEELDATARRLLSSLEFNEPSQPPDSLELPDATAQTGSSRPRLAELERTALVAGRAARMARADGLAAGPQDATARGPVTQPRGPAVLAPAASFEPPVLDPAEVPEEEEFRLNDGCFRADSRFFVQTQHGKFANSRFGPELTGWTFVGRPNFWGHFTHGALGFGRCVSGGFTNDLFAIDYPLAMGDTVFCPFKRGTVRFVGRSDSHINYGIMVVIEATAPNGSRYVSMSAHLSGLARGIVRGAQVTDETVIGFADATGDPGSIPVGEPHLHQAFYRNPSFVFIPGQGFTGPPFGGQGLQVIYHHFEGDARGSGPGVYKLDRTTHAPSTGTVPSSGRFRISN
jgi:hypothetical protein